MAPTKVGWFARPLRLTLLTALSLVATALGASGARAVSPPRVALGQVTAPTQAMPDVAAPPTATGLRALAARLDRGGLLPVSLVTGPPATLAGYLARRPTTAAALARQGLGDPGVAAALGADLAALSATARSDPSLVRAAVARLSPADRARLALLLPVQVAALSGMPFDLLALANGVRLAAALDGAGANRGAPYAEVLGEHRRLLSFDPRGNGGRGSWSELVGEIGPATRDVAVLVAGGSATFDNNNLDRYYRRARTFVAASGGRLAVIVWAAGDFPMGWVQEAMTHYDLPLARRLVTFSHALRLEIDSVVPIPAAVAVTVAGHSYGGAVVGTAERYGLDADRILHIASAGTGVGVGGPWAYTDPERPRYSMTGPGDWISFVQGKPAPPGVGHGLDPDAFTCMTVLPTGRLPSNPAALDESGRPLGARAGEVIGGRSAHSAVFIVGSDAWRNILAVFLGTAPATSCTPPAWPRPLTPFQLPAATPRPLLAGQRRIACGADRLRRRR